MGTSIHSSTAWFRRGRKITDPQMVGAIPPEWEVHQRVVLHLLSLGATHDEIEQLKEVVGRAIAEKFHSLRPDCVRRIYMRCTARNRYKNGASASVFAMAPFAQLPHSKRRATNRIIYEMPLTGKFREHLDPWAKLWTITDLDLNLPHR